MSQGANENSKKEQTTSRDVGKEKQKKKACRDSFSILHLIDG